MVDGQEATRGQRAHQAPDDAVGLVGVGDMVQDAEQHQRDGFAEIHGAGGLGQDVFRIAQVTVDVVAGALACASTSGSLSTYTIRDSGATCCATSCVFSAVGSPVPMSRNWRMPSWPAT